MISKDLAQQAKILKNSPYFINHTEVASLSEKQSIFLVLAGKKPVSEATSSRWVKTDHGAHAEPDNMNELQALLDSFGLVCHLRSDEYATDALVSYDHEKLDAYLAAEKAGDAVTIGQLFGYPKTATEAFMRDTCMDPKKQEALMVAAGVPYMIPSFRFSNAYAQQELAVLKDWYQTLRQYGLI